MKTTSANNIRLGIFITIGTVALIAALYLIGSNRNIFSNTIKISSQFYNVNGLIPGNNVRYAGIDIGTVEKIKIENDSNVTVYMIIEKNNSIYIKKNSIASVGTDGLMGNKLININPGSGSAPTIEEGDVLISLRPIENDEMIRTLNTTNKNLEAITEDLKNFTSRLNKSRGILKLIEDSVSADNIRQTLAVIRDAAVNANNITLQLNKLATELNNGKGLAATLIRDTVISYELKTTISNLQQTSDSLNLISQELSQFSKQLNNKNSLLHAVSADTALAGNVKDGIENLKLSTELLNENLKAMRSNFLFRRYFKKNP
ncbi:MAG: MCE family protein [Bacteroidetes bacterium]|nr:MCE family protein [Bacteroidota bacterium]MBK7969269.1 MCE family protein [Bacteroidota bacterium]MBK8416524.1 MCE family protein [Bacteroidota bacterium]